MDSLDVSLFADRVGNTPDSWAYPQGCSSPGSHRDRVSATWCQWDELPPTARQSITALSEQWVADKLLPEMGFSHLAYRDPLTLGRIGGALAGAYLPGFSLHRLFYLLSTTQRGTKPKQMRTSAPQQR